MGSRHTAYYLLPATDRLHLLPIHEPFQTDVRQDASAVAPALTAGLLRVLQVWQYERSGLRQRPRIWVLKLVVRNT